MSLAAPSWNELGLLLFPDWIITRSTGAEDFDTSIIRVGRNEHRNSPYGNAGYQRVSLAGATIEGEELQEWNTFRALTHGARTSFLLRNIRHCRMDHSQIGVGDGVQTVFQAGLSSNYQGQSHFWPVQYLDHNYPPRELPDGRICWPTQILRAWINGVDKFASVDFDVDRNTGLITFHVAPALGAIITISGYFLTRVRFVNDFAPTETDDAQSYEIPDGVELIEVTA